MDFDKKNPNRWRRVLLCRTADRVDRTTFKQTILDVIDSRQDEEGRQVKIRLMGAIVEKLYITQPEKYPLITEFPFKNPRLNGKVKRHYTHTAAAALLQLSLCEKLREWPPPFSPIVEHLAFIAVVKP